MKRPTVLVLLSLSAILAAGNAEANPVFTVTTNAQTHAVTVNLGDAWGLSLLKPEACAREYLLQRVGKCGG